MPDPKPAPPPDPQPAPPGTPPAEPAPGSDEGDPD
jgi:hypothetical protein